MHCCLHSESERQKEKNKLWLIIATVLPLETPGKYQSPSWVPHSSYNWFNNSNKVKVCMGSKISEDSLETLGRGSAICQTGIIVGDKVNQETPLAKDPRTEHLFLWDCGPAFSQITGSLWNPSWSTGVVKWTSELLCLCRTVHSA